MKHIKENILIYISLGLSALVFIIPFLTDSDGIIEEIKTKPTSNIAWNILLYILMHIVLAFFIFILLFIAYVMYVFFRQVYTEYKRSKAKAVDSIFAAIRLNDIQAVKNHISRGLDLNTVTEDGFSPLHRAVEGDPNTERETENLEIIELLLNKGADVNGKDDNDDTPLHLSINRNISELLIEHGADVNVKDSFGSTPLHSIIFNEDKDWVALLITNGADLNLMNEEGQTPLDQLSSVELEGVTAEIAILLRKHGAKTAEEFKAEGNKMVVPPGLEPELTVSKTAADSF